MNENLLRFHADKRYPAILFLFIVLCLGFKAKGLNSGSEMTANSSLLVNNDTLLIISGNILDESGHPIPGATIVVKGTRQGTISNERGEFVINGVTPKSKLVISSLRFVSQEFLVDAKWKWRSFVLKENIRSLDETVVSAYMSTSKRYSVGGITTITADKIKGKPVTNPLLALQGEVPGLVINQNTGFANGGVTVQIRGQNSFINGIDPLYVIDGVPYPSQMVPLVNGVGGRSGTASNASATSGNTLSFINPNDIESISILKDADATSIYGSRAAAGAIIITTKKGKSGSTKINVNFQKGVGKVTRFLDLLNAKQYLAMRHTAFANDGFDISSTDYDLNGTWDTTRSTNWQKKLIGGTANFTDIQSSISGGTENLQYLIGLGYHKETTVYPIELGDQKGSVHLNLNSISDNKKFTIQFKGNFMVDNNRLPVVDLSGYATRLSPVAPALYKPDGTLNWETNKDSVSTWQNPLAELNARAKTNTANLISNLVLEYEIMKGLKIKSNFGYTVMQTNEIQAVPLTVFAPEIRKYLNRFTNYTNGNRSSWIVEPQINYNKEIGKGRFETLIGTSLQDMNTNSNILLGENYSSDLLLEDPKSAGKLRATNTLNSQYRYNAIFGILNYRWKEKYIINLSARRDGSSRFGQENLFHNFASIAGGWIFSSEPWLINKLPVLSFGKIRASYGTSGNDQIGDYKYISNYSSYVVQVPYQGIVALKPDGIPNPYLQWEETRKLQFGIDIGVINDKILASINYYRNRSSNQLLAYRLPGISGASFYPRNLPATIQNMGWEFEVSTVNIAKVNFSWKSNINLTISRNKLISFPGLEESVYASSYKIGKPMTGNPVVRFHGVDPQTGLYDFYDYDGKITSTPDSKAATVSIDNSPRFYAGMGNTFSYGGFTLNFLFQGTRQIVPNYAAGSFPGYFSGNAGNQPTTILDGYWKKPGDIALIQKFSTVPQPTSFIIDQTTFTLLDIWYVRLKNLSVSWNVPGHLCKNLGMKNIACSLACQNVFTFTNFKGSDPESTTGTLPPLRVIMAGINIGF
jgi:TonB-linked SusC/RagA family outer membrane protein